MELTDRVFVWGFSPSKHHINDKNRFDSSFYFLILKQNQQYIHANCKHTYTNYINDMI